jgi:dUTPase
MENIEPKIKDISYSFDNNGKIVIDSIEHGSPYYIGKGEKFAQLVLAKVSKASMYKVETIEMFENDGRNGGFGSTGLK